MGLYTAISGLFSLCIIIYDPDRELENFFSESILNNIIKVVQCTVNLIISQSVDPRPYSGRSVKLVLSRIYFAPQTKFM